MFVKRCIIDVPVYLHMNVTKGVSGREKYYKQSWFSGYTCFFFDLILRDRKVWKIKRSKF